MVDKLLELIFSQKTLEIYENNRSLQGDINAEINEADAVVKERRIT